MRNVLRLLMVAALAVTVGIGAYAAGPAVAAGGAPNSDIDESAVELNDLAKVDDVKTSAQEKGEDPDEILEKLIEEYYESEGVEEGFNKAAGNKFFASATQMVNVNATSPDFGKVRVLAYDRAYQTALGKFAQWKGQGIAATTAAEFFQDSSTSAAEFEEELSTGKSSVGALVDKVIALGDALASDKLRELGVDPEGYSAAPPDQKKVLMRDAFTKDTARKVFQSFGGVTTVQTFFSDDGSGEHWVGVILMHSPKLEAVAQALRVGTKPALLVQGKPLKEQIPFDDKAKMFDLLGTRALFDENGLVVVSYGQWSNSYSGNDSRMRNAARKAATEQADLQATAQIAEFLHTSFVGDSSGQASEEIENAVVKSGKTGEISPADQATAITDIIRMSSKRRTSANLHGVDTKRWRHKTPEGHEIIGVVKTFSFGSMEAAKESLQPPKKPAGSKAAPAGSGKASGRSGDDQMDLNVF